MKYWVAMWVLSLVACGSAPQTQLPLSTETLIPPTATPHYIVITHVVKVKVVVTTTPGPLLAQECINTARTQLELTGCGALEWQLAREELEKTVSRIEFSVEEQQIFDQLQQEWQKQVENDCEFF